MTPLTVAAFSGRIEIVCYLLENTKIDVDFPTETSKLTPLIVACSSGFYEIVRELLEWGADVNKPSLDGQTPFSFCFGRLDETTNLFENKSLCLAMSELLLNYGADINVIVDKEKGNSLLMQYCGLSMVLSSFENEVNIEVINFLLEHGADRTQKNKKGETAWDLAHRSLRCSEIRLLLKNTHHKYIHPTRISTFTYEAKEETAVKFDRNGVKCVCFSIFKQL
eukprot:TRINITY_DN64923_c0_g1_i1.p1 TRINITY_DN64923_c0_g1~~TRINITY_DN64923_c0_g1_i1.p1  ORF type:complete len:223 (-),score=23.15 TRINITY_DN64923_c0_g1_i1:131-799(-)